MPDFTSALYLGLRHGSRELRPWSQLSLGRPAALAQSEHDAVLAQRVATLTGLERAVFAPSTLHLFWDAFLVFGAADRVIYLDRGSYPIARWGAERAAARGLTLRLFSHHDPRALERLLSRDDRRGTTPIVATDGYCPSCHAVAPLAEYVAMTAHRRGLVLVDDTQALGVLGCAAGRDGPYGRGGGGSVRWLELAAPHLLVVASMAKGFGVPVAMLAGSAASVRQFEMKSETRVHCSPPSVAVMHAAGHALDVNDRIGDAIRLALAANVSGFRRAVHEKGLRLRRTLFPVQTLVTRNVDARRVHDGLLARGVRALLHGPAATRAHLTFLITATHEAEELRATAAMLAEVVARCRRVRQEENTHERSISLRT